MAGSGQYVVVSTVTDRSTPPIDFWPAPSKTAADARQQEKTAGRRRKSREEKRTHLGRAHVVGKAACELFRQANVGKHTFQFAGELMAAFDLELGEDAALRLVRARAAQQKALGKMRLIVSLKDILVFEQPKDRQRLVKRVAELLFVRLFGAAAKPIVHKKRQKFSRPRLLNNKFATRLLIDDDARASLREKRNGKRARAGESAHIINAIGHCAVL